MKKIFLSSAVTIFTIVLLLFVSSSLMAAAEDIVDNGTVTKEGVPDKSPAIDKDTKLKEAEQMIKEGQGMVEVGRKTSDSMIMSNGKRMMLKGIKMKKDADRMK